MPRGTDDTLTVGVLTRDGEGAPGGLAPADAASDVLVVTGGADAVRAVVAEDDRPVLAAAAGVDRRGVTALLDAGAAGIVDVDDAAEAIQAAARAALAGYLVVPRALRAVVRRPVLTARQKQILSLLVLGLRNQDIAARLFLSEATVKTHLTAIFAELGVTSRKQAVDLILDPAAGLGTGILGIADPRAVQAGYGAPRLADGAG